MGIRGKDIKMKNSKFFKSQKAHIRLMNSYFSKGNTDKNRALGNYNPDVADRQAKTGKIIHKKERRKIFAWWLNYETKHLNK